jgi:hypothetical protein
MWLFTTLGFFSITRSRLQPDHFQIRARDEKHVSALAAHMDLEMLTPGFLGPILESPTADYRWRCMVNEARMLRLQTSAKSNPNQEPFHG